jgi:iron complex transport system substrate-binding protein
MMRMFALLLSVVVATQSFAEETVIETASGPVTVSGNPVKAAVLDLSALDTLQALGVPVSGVPSKLYLPYLDAGGAQVVGSLFEPDFEAVNALQPDLIVVGGRMADQAKALGQLGQTVDMTIGNDALEDGLKRLATYGALFGKEDVATRLEAEINDKIQALSAVAQGKGKALVIMTNGPKISAYGKESRFGWLYGLGFSEAVENVKETTHGEAVSFEFIREANPDVLLVVDRLAAIGRDGTSARETLDNDLVRETTASKTGQVIYLSSAPVYISYGGIQSLNVTLDELLAAFSRS